MNDSVDGSFALQLAALRAQFSAQLAGTLDELNRLMAGRGPDVPRELLEQLHLRLHKLAGAGGTFGFPELSKQASALEDMSQVWLRGEALPPMDEWQTWLAGLRDLRHTISNQDEVLAIEPTRPAPALTPVHKGAARVVLVHSDSQIRLEMCQGLAQFGYAVSSCADLPAVEDELLTDPPDILLLEISDLGTLEEPSQQAVARLVGALGTRLTLIFLASQVDFAKQLVAAKAGGEAFLTQPVDAPTVAACIEVLVRQREQSPYRVLIVEDDEVLAEHYRLTLCAAGMLAYRQSHPMAVLPAIQKLRPDVLLMDLHMPECSGAELARVIRYDENWQSLPIILMSTESDLERQVRAMGSGADDFLVKPITDLQLVVGIRVRAARARKLSELMNQDSLTGLLKHASIKERLKQEIDRSNRSGKPVSVAMVDIDFFKRVNDQWGHPMGDQVIKTLGNLLRQRLRRQDSVGRYGGEEFLIILPECSEADATRLLDDIRRRFADINFSSGGQNFKVTLSAGIAANLHLREAHALLGAADVAMYEAKNRGRNQVCCVTPGEVKTQE